MDRDGPEVAAPEQAPAVAPVQQPAVTTGPKNAPPGKDSYGQKENILKPFWADMVEVAHTLAPQFTALGLTFRPEILLATAMQEADNKDPVGNRSFDNGLGIMQITPYKGQLDEPIAKAIHWDNNADLETNIQKSNWRNAKANIMAGGQEILGKAKAVRGGATSVWAKMDERHRWRATMYAYNAGQRAAINALNAGGPNAEMSSSFHYKGKLVTHSYTNEWQEKSDYVNRHDVFQPGGGGPQAGEPAAAAPAAPAAHEAGHLLQPHAPAHDAPANVAPMTAAANNAAAAHTPVAATPATATPATTTASTATPATTTAPGTTPQEPVKTTPGGHDALGQKENLLAPFYEEMRSVASEVAPKFTPYGLAFRPQILLATAMQEAAARDPLHNRSFDNGLGIMQITPYRGKLDAGVAAAIGWDNNADLETNISKSNWRNARANLVAGAETMLGKARSIKHGAPAIWEKMDEPHKWRAVLYAYNAGERAALKSLREGGPDADMISTYTNQKHQVVHHDYTAEITAKMSYVDVHDPFGGGVTPGQDQGQQSAGKQRGDSIAKPQLAISGSVGRGGKNASADVRAVQRELESQGIQIGRIDGIMGDRTIAGIIHFQRGFMHAPDGIIEPGNLTAKHLFGLAATTPGAVQEAGGPAPGATELA
jgi:hypothetical protein